MYTSTTSRDHLSFAPLNSSEEYCHGSLAASKRVRGKATVQAESLIRRRDAFDIHSQSSFRARYASRIRGGPGQCAGVRCLEVSRWPFERGLGLIRCRKWAGCPQALQGRKCNPDESKTRIWLLDDGTAEISLGAEVSGMFPIRNFADRLTSANQYVNSYRGGRVTDTARRMKAPSRPLSIPRRARVEQIERIKPGCIALCKLYEIQ